MPKLPKGRATVEKKARALTQLRVEYVPVTAIHPNAYNPNRQSDHDFHLLILSILEDGFTQPVVCQRATHDIIDGEHRWTAQIVVGELVKQGITHPTIEQTSALRARRLELLDPTIELPVVFTDMTPEQMRIATLRHNRARGSEDYDLAAQVIKDLQELGALAWAQDSLLLSDEDITHLLADLPAPEALAAEAYSSAWEPDRLGEHDRANMEAGTTEARVVSQDAREGVHVTALSVAAIEASRQREAQIAAAKTQEERQMAARAENLYRLSLVFAGEEASLVQRVLGHHPAERLIALCREVASHEAEALARAAE